MNVRAYYNEHDPFAAAWLRNLIDAGHIAHGDVDERSIIDVRPSELAGYTQCHFFAGIGGWSYALRLAGWPDDRPVWTGSCPCQPFSAAGKKEGFSDPRHLWPVWKKLIVQCRPAVVFGEQVAAASQWLNLVRGDLEEMGYAVGAIPMEAASADAEHFRDRYWIVADRDEQCTGAGWLQRGGQFGRASGNQEDSAGPLADGGGAGSQEREGESSDIGAECQAAERNSRGPLVNDPSHGWGEGWTESEFRSRGFTAAVASIDGRQYLECPDGKWRRLPPPRVRWLGNGIPARVAKLRAIGNAIVPQVAAEFIRAFSEVRAA